MKIEVYSVPDQKDMVSDVWLYSRPKLHSANTEEIKKIDAPINDFPSIILKVKSTIIEREIIASFRDHIMWARTSRVEDPIYFTVPDDIYNKNGKYYAGLRNKMELQKIKGVPQDEYRMLLPIVAETEYMLKVSPRTLAKIYHQFTFLCQDVYCFDSAVDALRELLQKLRIPYLSYKPVNVNPILVDFGTGKLGDYGVVTAEVPFSLRSHLIRHNILSVKDSIVDTIKYSIYDATLGHGMFVQVGADKEVWRSIYRKRSCWLAHYRMWEKILTPVANMFIFKEGELPCNDGACPYDGDAKVRYTSADPGFPCPIHARINGKEIDKNDIRKQIKIDNRPVSWQEYSK